LAAVDEGAAERPAELAPAPGADAGLAEAARQVGKVARQTAESGAAIVAAMLAQQAAALASGAGDSSLAREMDQFMREQGRSALSGQRTCPACKGDGKRKMLFANFEGEVHEQVAANMRCPVCEGRGTVRGQLSSDRAEARLVEGRRRADELLRALRYTDQGGVWIPEGAADRFGARQQAALRTSVARACTACFGLGGLGCTSCQGAGRDACDGDGCVMGQAVCPDCGGKRRMTAQENGRSLQQTCRTCRQTGIVNCPTCRGRGWRSCTTCVGQGSTSCKKCAGKGQATACTKCVGQGLVTCRHCDGTGSTRGAPCVACKGDKLALCTTCDGFGRRMR
jgi:DnaJ-class molecular chaperone